MGMQTFKATAKDVETRLDVFLAGEMKGVSRTKIQKAIKSGEILLNGKKVTPHIALDDGDEVAVPEGIVSPDESGKILQPRADVELVIVHEDAELAVIDKPSGMLVHPTVRSEQDTLVNALISRYPEMAEIGESPERPGIMHRLDKEASGLLAVARTKKAYRSLKKQFQDHKIKKEYLVLVHGRPPDDEGSVTLSIGRAESGNKMAAHSEETEGDKTAVTHYRVEEVFGPGALLRVNTETGRTHQIRAHFKALGCSVAGDPLYKTRNMTFLPVTRLFLHCTTLGFTHPGTKKWVEFTSPLPAELENVLTQLRKSL